MSKKTEKETAPIAAASVPSVVTNDGKDLAAATTPLPTAEELGFDTSDILIPKMLLMQGLSDLVNDEKAAVGDIVDSLTEEKLGDKDKPVEVVPVLAFKTWVEFEKEKGAEKFEFKAVYPMTAANAQAALEFTREDGVSIRRDRCLNFYVLHAKDLAAGDVFPHLVSFRRYSYSNAGKKLATHMLKAGMVGAKPWSKTVLLGAYKEKNDLGTFYVYDLIQGGRKTTPEEQAVAERWNPILKAGTVKVDNSDFAKGDAADRATPVVAEYAERF